MKQKTQFQIPEQLEMICDLLETTVQQILQAFINDLSHEINSSGSDERRMAWEYFMRVGYGMHRYDFDQVEQMFEEVNTLRFQWPGNDAEKEKEYRKQRKLFLKEWHKQWKSKAKK